MVDISIQLGVPENVTNEAVALYCNALTQKITPFLGKPERATPFLAKGIVEDRAFIALADGKLAGIAGFKLDGKGLFNPSIGNFFKEYGMSAVIRMAGLALLERPEESGCLLMDGIAVCENMRGMGIGTQLLQAIENHAQRHKKTSIRLDVISTNPNARRLYERFGFVAGKTTDLRPLKKLFDFEQATEMRKKLAGTM